MKKSVYSDEQLRLAVAGSRSFKQTIETLGLHVSGGNHRQIKKRLAALPDCDTSHFYHTGKPPAREKRVFVQKVIPLDQLLIENCNYSSKSLKRRLISEGVMENVCVNGHPPVWMGKKITLHLDHINGVHTDCRIENLRLLCPNCHAITETYCRGIRRKKMYECIDCNKQVSGQSSRCHRCAALARPPLPKITWPEPAVVLQMVQETSLLSTARSLGVSDTTVKKFLRKRGLLTEAHFPVYARKAA